MHLQVRPMRERRRGYVCEIIGNDMYVIGGFSGLRGTHKALLTTEVYDARADASRAGPHIGLRRAFGYSGVINDTIYTLCGMQSVRVQCKSCISPCAPFACVCNMHAGAPWFM
jgi:hypothetical protein